MAPTTNPRIREIPAISPEDPQKVQQAVSLIVLALKALSQRTIVALASLRDLFLIGSVFWLFLKMLENPTTLRLIGCGGYAVTILVAIVILSGRKS